MDDREAYQFYADPANWEVTGPPVRRKPLRRSFTCPHMSVGNVISASCGTCGPLHPVPVTA